MQHNMKSYLNNKDISVMAVSDKITTEEINNVIEVLTSKDSVSDPSSRLSETESVLFERMLN